MGSNLSNTELMFVNACKSLSPRKEVVKVYESEYGVYDDKYVHITVLLCDIVDKYLDVKSSYFIETLNPKSLWFYLDEGKLDYYQASVNILISKIRLSEAKLFPGIKEYRKQHNEDNTNE